jgi:inner membrane protein
MDPFTQGTLGAALPQATRHKASIAAAGALGFLSGMAADLDVLIRSPVDPLLFLEYHRQFTHALIFIPLGGLITALVLHWLLGRRWKLSFAQTALFCTLGYATHALLDTATSYGTMLLWPFSDHRFAWRIVSVIDPLFTGPLAMLVAASALKRSPAYARAGLIWAGLYLSLGALQHHAALQMGRDIAAARGHRALPTSSCGRRSMRQMTGFTSMRSACASRQKSLPASRSKNSTWRATLPGSTRHHSRPATSNVSATSPTISSPATRPNQM